MEINFFKKNTILSGKSLKSALKLLGNLKKEHAVIFIVDENKKLMGSLTDGDIRRVLINKSINLKSSVNDSMNKSPGSINIRKIDTEKIISYRNDYIKILPVIDHNGVVVDFLNFSEEKNILSLDTIIMAGGRGERLKPLTNSTPKPLLKIDGKTIIDHKINSLLKYGIRNIYITVNYLGNKINSHIEQSNFRNSSISIIKEKNPLGTIGVVSKIKTISTENVLVTNADLLTDVDFEKFFLYHIKNKSDLTILSVPYRHTVPYATLEVENHDDIKGIKEKPTYRYLTNGGIYLIKSIHLKLIPKNTFYNATDLIELLISKELKVKNYFHEGNWIDVGNPTDLIRAKSGFNNE